MLLGVWSGSRSGHTHGTLALPLGCSAFQAGHLKEEEADVKQSRDMKIKVLFLVLSLVASAPALKQYKRGMIFQDGIFVNPTEESALDEFFVKSDHDPAIAILTQTLEERPASELDAFADELVQIMLDHRDEIVRLDARFVLEKAARGDNGGTPYVRAQDTFIELYESLEGTAGGAQYLQAVYASGRGDYVQDVLRLANKPEKACVKRGLRMSIVGMPEPPEEKELCPYKQYSWCAAAKVLVDNGDNAVSDLEALPLCFGYTYRDGQWWESIR